MQSNPVHMIVEADSNQALARGMMAFTARSNRLFNAAWGRKRGQVWGDRYHRRDLTSPRAVRNALVYCLNNFRKHRCATPPGAAIVDAMSSGPWFEGWLSGDIPNESSRPTPRPETWLLRRGWHRGPLIHIAECPRAAA